MIEFGGLLKLASDWLEAKILQRLPPDCDEQ